MSENWINIVNDNIRGLDEDEDYEPFITLTDPTERMVEKIPQRLFDELDIEYFKAFKYFGENNATKIKLACPAVPEKHLASWRSLFNTIKSNNETFQFESLNETYSTCMLIDYIYTHDEKMSLLVAEQLDKILREKKAHNFTIDGLYQLEKACEFINAQINSWKPILWQADRRYTDRYYGISIGTVDINFEKELESLTNTNNFQNYESDEEIEEFIPNDVEFDIDNWDEKKSNSTYCVTRIDNKSIVYHPETRLVFRDEGEYYTSIWNVYGYIDNFKVVERLTAYHVKLAEQFSLSVSPTAIIDISPIAEPFKYVFQIPNDKNELEAYCDHSQYLRQHLDLSILHSRSIRPVQNSYGQYSTFPVPVPTYFGSWLQKFSEDLYIPQLLGNDCVIAGGAIVSAFFNLENSAPDSDLDLWIFSQQKLYDIANMYAKFYPNAYFIVNYSVVTIVIPDKTRYIQLIFRDTNPWQVINSFDMDYVQAYYNGEEIRAFPECINAWKTKKATPNKDTQPERIMKAREKGFEIDYETSLEFRKSRWNFYYPRKEENREHVRHLLHCLYPRAQGVVDDPEEIPKLLRTNCQYHVIDVGSPKLLQDVADMKNVHFLVNKTNNNIINMIFDTPIVLKMNGLVVDSINSKYMDFRLQLKANVNSERTLEMLQKLDQSISTLINNHSQKMGVKDNFIYYPMLNNSTIKLNLQFTDDHKTTIVDGITGQEMTVDELTRKNNIAIDVEVIVTHCYTVHDREMFIYGCIPKIVKMVVWPNESFTKYGSLCGIIHAWHQPESD